MFATEFRKQLDQERRFRKVYAIGWIALAVLAVVAVVVL
jgi:hypothetical protein